MASAYAGEITGPAAVADILDQANAMLAQALLPLRPLIQASPEFPDSFKQDLYHRPIDAMLGLFQPVESMALDIIQFANEYSNKFDRNIGIPGVNAAVANMNVVQPGDEQITDVTLLNFIRRLRMVTNFMILCYEDPVALAVGTGRALVKRGRWAQSQLDAFMNQLLSNAPAPVQQLVTNVRSEVNTISTGAKNTVAQAVNETKILAPIVQDYMSFLARVGPLYAGMANTINATSDVSTKSGADKVYNKAISANHGLSPASSDILGKIITVTSAIKNNASDLQGKKDGYKGPGVGRGAYLLAQAALYRPLVNGAGITLGALGLGGLGGLWGLSGPRMRGLGGYGGLCGVDIAAGAGAGTAATTAGTGGTVSLGTIAGITITPMMVQLIGTIVLAAIGLGTALVTHAPPPPPQPGYVDPNAGSGAGPLGIPWVGWGIGGIALAVLLGRNK